MSNGSVVGEAAISVPTFGPPLDKASEYHALARQIQGGTVAGRPVRVAVLSTYTAEFIRPALTVELCRLGLAPTLYFAGFGQLESLVFDEQSALYRFEPDLVVIALRIEDAHIEATTRVANGGELAEAAERCVSRLETLCRRLVATRRCVVLTANFAMPEPSPFGIGDAALPASHAAQYAKANAALRDAITPIGACHVWDYAGLVRARGAEQWSDARLWFLARIPVAASHHGWMAQHLARTIRAALMPAAKVLVLDLDNTIWGGVLGDDGVAGLVLGDEYPGSEFKALQRRILALRDRGVLLVAASKNDQPLAEDAFRNHPEMLIRWEHLAAHRINWGPKSVSIMQMAEELSLGLDAFVFLDDNPVEQAEVRAACPSVKIVDWDVWGSMNRALANCPWFDTLATSAEDFVRAELYARDRERREEATNFQSVEDFLASLDMYVDIGRTGAVDRDRVAQLIAKTNQFNVTGRRHPASVLAGKADTPDESAVCHLRLRDRFGDQGLVAAAVLEHEGHVARIDVLVMSCRVMNRQVEFALLAFLREIAESWGCSELVGDYVPSARNAMVRDLFARAGFSLVDGKDGETQRWSLVLGHEVLPWPALISRGPAD